MLKKLLLMAVTLVATLLVIVVVGPYFIPGNTLKAHVLGNIQRITGRNVTVSGRFRISLFPVAGVSMQDVTMSNQPRYGDTGPLMTAKSIDIEVDVIPLLRGNVVVKKLVLDEPQFNLHVTKDGIRNWLPPGLAFPAVARVPGPTLTPQPAPNPSVTPSISLPRNLMLSDVKLKDGTIVYNNEAANTHWEIKKLDIALALNGLASPFTVDASSEWNGKSIAIKATIATLQTLFNQVRTQVDADVQSDLLSLGLHGFIDGVRYTGKTDIKSPSLKALLAWLDPTGTPMHMQAPLAINASSDVDCMVFMCSLTNTSLTLDNIQAKGSIKISRAAGGGQPPQVDVIFTTGMLDFNPFLPGPQAGASIGLFSDAYAETDGRWSDKPVDLSALQAINGTAYIAADGMVVNKITMGKTALRATLQNGRLNADVINAVMYGGTGTITVSVDASSAVPTLQKHASFKGVQVQPLFKDALDMSRLSGMADIDMAVTSQGNSEKAWVENLAGSGKFILKNGAIEGVDLTNLIANKSDGGVQKTPIIDMRGSFTIAQGLVSNKDLTMVLPTLHVGGQGEISLPAYSIDYRLMPQVVQAAGAGGAVKQGVGVPVIVEGSLEKPSFRPDLKGAVQQALKDPKAFKEQLKATRDSLKQQLNNPDAVKNVKNLLQGWGN